jgi:hypothetical protein
MLPVLSALRIGMLLATGRDERWQLGVNTYLVASGDFLHAFGSRPQEGARAGRAQAREGQGHFLISAGAPVGNGSHPMSMPAQLGC